jgi:hypothetical protein
MRSRNYAAALACAVTAAIAGCSSGSQGHASSHAYSAQAVAGALNRSLPSPPSGPELEVALVYHVHCLPARAASFTCDVVRDTQTPTSTARGDLRLTYGVTVDDRGCWTARLRHSSQSLSGSDYVHPPHGCGLTPA